MSTLYDHDSTMKKIDDLIINTARTGGLVSTSIQGLSDKIREANANIQKTNASAETSNKRMFWLTVAIAVFAFVQAMGILIQALIMANK